MRPRFSAEDEAFRRDVRQYLRAHLPIEIAAKVRHGQPLTRADYMLWQDVLARRNWYAIGWPKKVAGPGLSLTQRYLFEQEHGNLPTPRVSQFGIAMAGPVIYTFGSEAQKSTISSGHTRKQDILVPRLFRTERGI
jgi:alkylation response protein AidB-like acyl-CoA dehydrogenase